MPLVVETRSLVETDQLASGFVTHIPAGTTVAISGTLGAGKTRFVQGVGKALGMDPSRITSPTFVLCNEHLGRVNMYHLDAYRLQDSDQFLELGIDEMFQTDHYVFIEWADQVQDCLPREHLSILIEIVSSTERRFVIDASATLADYALQWQRSLARPDSF